MFCRQVGGSRTKEAKKDQEIGSWGLGYEYHRERERGIKAIQKVVIMHRGMPFSG